MPALCIPLAVLFLFLFIPAADFSQSAENRIQHQVESRLAAGEKPNRLINEKSPYLLQHAFNPVDWFPWGDQAFDKAKKEGKPIFLSIGYSTCHWCHVMAEESFANQEIADILNKWFISIKVDREERPDIDQMYMTATQAMTGSGGWPMSVFLLPDGSPFFAGTYFPAQSSDQRPGFKMILTSIHKAWLERRDTITASAAEVMEALESFNASSTSSVNTEAVTQAYDYLAKSYDETAGGFGNAPKFPRPSILSFLFDYSIYTGDESAEKMVLHTLDRMAAGGMYDQLGGGFHRYSVDKLWLVPHFEKMLYDQAQLIHSYLTAYQVSKDKKYAKLAREIINYALRDMRDVKGGFYSAEDADSDDPYSPGRHGEGAYYLWTKDDVEKQLGKEQAAVFIAAYGIEKDGNVDNDPFQEFTARNILHRAQDVDEVAAQFNKSVAEMNKYLQSSRKTLFDLRKERKRPHLDDKIITSWNGMMIGALARASRILADQSLQLEAEKTAAFLQKHLFDGKKQRLYRRYRSGEAGLKGQLDDYAYLVDGLIELYQTTQNPHWLQWSVQLTEQQIALFWNKEAKFFYDSVTDDTVKVRMRSGYDGAVPAGNSVSAHNLIRLGIIRNNSAWKMMVSEIIQAFADTFNDFPSALPVMLNAWQQLKGKPVQVVIAGLPDEKDTRELLSVVHAQYSPGLLILLADETKNQDYLAEKLPFIQSVTRQEGKATAYVCFDFTCKLPVTESKALYQQLLDAQLNKL